MTPAIWPGDATAGAADLGMLIGVLAVALAGLVRVLWSTTLRDVLAGAVLRLGHFPGAGRRIVAAGHAGEVVRIGLRATALRTAASQIVSIPNAMLLAGPVLEHSSAGMVAPVTARVLIPIGADVRRVRALVQEVANRVASLQQAPPPQVSIGEIGPASAEIVVSGQATATEAAAAETELRLSLLDAIAAAGLPPIHTQHDVHLRDLDFVKAAIARVIEQRERERGDGGASGPSPGQPPR